MYHTGCEDNEEMYPGDQRVGSQKRVDEAKEQEGVDCLHVIAVGPREQTVTVSRLSTGASNTSGTSWDSQTPQSFADQ